MLTDPEANLRLGTAYLAAKVREFGDLHLVLASYNAGESPVHRWLDERPGLSREEFIDDIPYPETQNYVKRILGTAEDYRRIYGSAAGGVSDDDEIPGGESGRTGLRCGAAARREEVPRAKKKAAPAKPARKRRAAA